MRWWNRARAVNAFFADAVFVYKVTGDGPVKTGGPCSREGDGGPAARRRREVRARRCGRHARTAYSGSGPDGAAALLEQLASEISLRDSTIRDVVDDRCTLADLDEDSKGFGQLARLLRLCRVPASIPKPLGERPGVALAVVDRSPEGRFSASDSPLAGVCRSSDRDIDQCVRASRKTAIRYVGPAGVISKPRQGGCYEQRSRPKRHHQEQEMVPGWPPCDS